MPTLNQIINRVASFKKKSKNDEIFFRGQRLSDKLIPSLIRNKLKFNKDISFEENRFYCHASIIGAGDLSLNTNSWETLAQLQHFRIPTRLLDWTSSLINALFFSIQGCLSCKDRKRSFKCRQMKKACRGNPVIWVLDSQGMHEQLFPEDPISELSTITVGIDHIQDYKECFIIDRDKWKLTNGPVFLEIPWKNKRISSQKGYFTFHPKDKPLECYINNQRWLQKIVISQSDIEKIINALEIMGITEHDIYSDLSSLGQFLIRKYL